MFPSTKGLFKNIECPGFSKEGKCKLPHCIFAHQKLKRNLERPLDEVDPQPVVKKKPLIVKPIELIPATIAHPPVAYPLRLQYLKIVRDKLEDFGTPKSKSNQLAIDLEAEESKRSVETTYKGNIRNLVRRISRKEYVEGAAEARAKEKTKSEKKIYDEELVNLVIPLQQLAKRYITEVPTKDYEQGDWFECDRCKQRTRFEDIVPNLNEGINRCNFHLLRRPWDPNTRKLEQTFPCCGATLEEQGCQDRFSHVFKLNEPSALHKQVKFVKIPETSGIFAIGIDCEMAYTTKGMELIRVTAVSWDTNKTVYDRIIRPSGTIIDLNTRFSGVSDIEAGLDLDGQHYDPISFEDSRQELFKIVGSNTIFIGHGLENDLNAMRLIHHRVVDTAMIYPRGAVKARTHSLKQLAWTFLSRIIQTGEHDSLEDSLAAMDIIKKDIKDRFIEGR